MWWKELATVQQVFFIVGCATLGFMVIQIILMLVGFSDDDAFNADIDADMDFDSINNEGITHLGLNIISIRSIIAFLCMGSFALFFFMFYVPAWAAVLLGLVFGAGAGVLMALAVNSLNKLQSSGNLDIRNCVGKIGDVYLTIPALKSGQGKVNIYVQERLAEFEAVTAGGVAIKTGSKVKVVGVVNEGLLLVEPLIIGETVEKSESEVAAGLTEQTN